MPVAFAISPPIKRRFRPLVRVAILFGFLIAAPQGLANELVLLVEDTAAMQDSGARSGTLRVIERLVESMPQDARIGLVAYDDLARVLLPLGANSREQRANLSRVLQGLSMTSPHANPGAGLERTLYELNQAVDVRQPAIVLFHTGGVHTGNPAQDSAFRRWAGLLAGDAGNAGTPIHVVSFGDTADGLAAEITTNSGGKHFESTTASRYDSVTAELATLLGGSAIPTVTADTDAVTAPSSNAITAPEATADAGAVTMPLSDGPTTPPALTEIATSDAEQDAEQTATISKQTQTTVPPTTKPSAEDLTPREDAWPATGSAAEQATAAKATTTSPTSMPNSPASERPLGLFFAVGSGVFAVVALLLLMRKRKGRVPEKSAGQPTEQPAAQQATVIGGACLIDREGVSGKARYDITGRVVRVSRRPCQDSANVICLTIVDDVISREHAVIECHDGAYWITDPGSNNGTFVNGSRIETATRLQNGDEVRFATHVFEFEQRESEGEASAVPGDATVMAPAAEDATIVQPAEAAAPTDDREQTEAGAESGSGGQPGTRTIGELADFDAESWLADGDVDLAHDDKGDDRTQIRKRKD